MEDSKQITDKSRLSNKIPAQENSEADKWRQINEKAVESGFKGKPIVAIKYINKLMTPTGDRVFDLESGRIAFDVGGEIIKNDSIGPIYFKENFIKEDGSK